MPGSFTLQDHPGVDGPMGPLFAELQERILALSPLVSMSIFKGLHRLCTNGPLRGCLPRKRALRVLLNMPFAFVSDLQGKCEDIGGTFGPFEAEIKLSSLADMDYCMQLVRQAYEQDGRS